MSISTGAERKKSKVPTLYVMIGPAGSGKSYVANRIPHAAIDSTDMIRELMFGSAECQDNPKEVFEEAYIFAEDALCGGLDVVFDATNTTAFARKKLLTRVSGINHKNVAIFMNTPLEECKRRNALRKRKVPDAVIERQYEQMLKDAGSIPEQFDEIVIVEGWRK